MWIEKWYLRDGRRYLSYVAILYSLLTDASSKFFVVELSTTTRSGLDLVTIMFAGIIRDDTF